MPAIPGTLGDDILYGTDDDDTITGLGGNDRLFGFGGNDLLDGGDGSDIIDGGTGADTMTGGVGDDFYILDNTGDVVTELAGEGSDLVFTFINYVLPTNVERLAVYDRASTFAVNLTGNALDNEITGNDGANVIDGGAGRDIMKGGRGDDQYVVSLQGVTSFSFTPNGASFGGNNYSYFRWSQYDLVADHAGEGTDTIWVPFTSSATAHNDIDYTLLSGPLPSTSNYIERLGVADRFSTYVVNLQGNSENNDVMGNDGQNILDGFTGADVLTGYGGNDIYFIDNAGDIVVEGAGEGIDTVYVWRGTASITLASFTLPDNVERLVGQSGGETLIGNALDNEITGNGLANVIDGKLGADILQGGAGLDTYAFTTALGAGNVDQIIGFSAGFEKIQLDDAVFTGLTPGALAAGAFTIGAAAGDADDRIIYDTTSGALYFDADGSGAGVQVQFANLHEGLALSAGDFTVI